jgi:hypothetical protein
VDIPDAGGKTIRAETCAQSRCPVFVGERHGRPDGDGCIGCKGFEAVTLEADVSGFSTPITTEALKRAGAVCLKKGFARKKLYV